MSQRPHTDNHQMGWSYPILPFRSSPKLSCLGWHGFTAWFPKVCIPFPLEPTTAERVILWDRQCVCPRPWLALP